MNLKSWLPSCFTQQARLALEDRALAQKSSTLSLEGWMNKKLGANAMNKTLGAHASQIGLS